MSKIVFDDHTNLLRENYYEYEVQDVPEANLFPEIFTFDEIPKVAFNQRLVPMHMPKDVWITDTTFRDGQQSRAPFTSAQILKLYDLMHDLGGPHGMIRQCEFFVYSAQDRQALEMCRTRGYRFPEITTWIRATESDFNLVKELKIRETGILVSCSDYHIFKKMNLTRSQAMEKYLSVVKMALDRGITPRCHFEDITRADFYGFVVPFAHALQRLSEESGIPIKIRCCDTLGLGVSYPGASLPRSVPGIIYGLRHYANVPSSLIEWHGHNDFYKGVSNAAAAWLYGASAVNCSLLGIGERTGNCPLEGMVMEYCSLRGRTDGMNLAVLTEIAEYFEKEIGYEIPPQTPFMGRDFCSTRAGIHADGLLKDERIYSIFDTGAILNRKSEVMIDAHSGAAGIAFWLNNHMGMDVDKKSPLVAAIKDRVDVLYEACRTTVMSNDELEAIAADEIAKAK
ncbi:Citrate (Re)-synthase [bioreactor metagenome]|jgi:isopropylmalate/homocitrate/citramalate synthase|uniref:Citrate (Re)-synthase n=1 Tax=bioreactor metagenome TaxID=1076179 RepID=A0A645ANY5_9ZZZZ